MLTRDDKNALLVFLAWILIVVGTCVAGAQMRGWAGTLARMMR